jgi:hypothetical protein
LSLYHVKKGNVTWEELEVTGLAKPPQYNASSSCKISVMQDAKRRKALMSDAGVETWEEFIKIDSPLAEAERQRICKEAACVADLNASRVFNVIDSFGVDGCDMTTMTKATKWLNASDRNSILNELVESKKVTWVGSPYSRKVTYWTVENFERYSAAEHADISSRIVQQAAKPALPGSMAARIEEELAAAQSVSKPAEPDLEVVNTALSDYRLGVSQSCDEILRNLPAEPEFVERDQLEVGLSREATDNPYDDSVDRELNLVTPERRVTAVAICPGPPCAVSGHSGDATENVEAERNRLLEIRSDKILTMLRQDVEHVFPPAPPIIVPPVPDDSYAEEVAWLDLPRGK